MKKVLLILTILFIFYSCKNLPDRDGSALPGNKIKRTEPRIIVDKEKETQAVKKAEEGNEDIKELTDIDKLEELEREKEIDGAEYLKEGEDSSDKEQSAEADKIPALPSLPFSPVVQTPSVPAPPAVQAPPARTTPPATPPAPAPVQPPVQTAPPVPPASPVPSVPAPANQPAAPEPEPPVDTSAQRAPPQITRETPPVPTPSTSMIVPLDRNNEVIFSRIVRATVGQIIEIPFRGTSWVYLGELASRRGIAYDSRRNDPDGLSFIFKAEEAGTYALKFSRHDFIRDYILNDHVQVIVGEAPAASTAWFGPPSEPTRIVAQPRWPSASEEAEILRGEPSRPVVVSPPYQSSESQTSSSTASSITERESARTSDVPVVSREQSRESVQPSAPSVASVPSTPAFAPNESMGSERTPEPARQEEVIPREQLIQRAKDTFENGNVQGAISLLDQYIASFPTGVSDDELYWLYGQFYEANSPARDIKLSLDYYKKLTTEFPQSNRFNDARRRIAYLERFYINIQ